MPYPRKITGFNAFVDGRSYFGRCEEAQIPTLELITETFRGAGMDMGVQVDMGMETMESELSFSEWAPELITTFGTRQRLVLRPAALGEADFEADTYIFTLGGRWKMQEYDALQPGSKSLLKLTQATDFFRCEVNGTVLVEIDAELGTRFIDGQDQLRSKREAMGIL